jgi:DNA-binding CsgD family transcriptional regulator
MTPERRRELLERYALRVRVLEERSRRASPGAVEAPAEPAPRRLTRREHQVLGLVADGHATPSIAHALGISAHSVDSHVRKLTAKLGAANRAHAVALGFRAGVL